MTDQRPSNAPDTLPDRPSDGEDAASRLSAEESRAPGGGGLGGADAGNPLAGGARSGTSPNSPIDIATRAPETDRPPALGGKETREAAQAAVRTPPPEPHPKSL